MKQGGWLTNESRRKRRDSPKTLTDQAALQLIQQIQEHPKYTKLDQATDQLLRLRDMALIGTAQTFFKRGNENLHIQLRDTDLTATEVTLTLHIEKKQKTLKLCSRCQKKNAQHANFCRYCGENIELVEAKLFGDKHTDLMNLSKSRDYVFSQYIVDWIKKLGELKIKEDSWIFPRYHFFSRNFLFHSKQPITIQRFDQILQNLDPTLTSCLFRYGGAENKLRLGYTPYELKEIGGWSSSKMPEIYATRKGLTLSQKKFTDDNRVI